MCKVKHRGAGGGSWLFFVVATVVSPPNVLLQVDFLLIYTAWGMDEGVAATAVEVAFLTAEYLEYSCDRTSILLLFEKPMHSCLALHRRDRRRTGRRSWRGSCLKGCSSALSTSRCVG